MFNDNISTVAKNSKRKENFLYQPKDFDPVIYGGEIAKHPDNARWFLNSVHHQRVTRNYGRSEYVNLHSELLAKVMGKTALVKPMRKALEDAGLLECDGEWSLGKKSLGYRLGPTLDGVSFERYYSTNKRFVKRFTTFKDYAKSTRTLKHPAHWHLRDWLQKVELTQDVDEAIQAIEDPEKRMLATHQAELIQAELISQTVCDYGRFHSNFTGLCREVRRCLSVGGKKLHEIDIVNSQPFFLSLLLLEDRLFSHNVANFTKQLFFKSEDDSLFLSSLTPKNSKKEEEREEEGEESRDTPYVFPFFESLGVEKDLRQFALSASQGTFYETFLGDNRISRDELKPKVFQVIYGERWVMDGAEMGETFKTIYPTAFEAIKRLKARKGYEWLGQELQKRESDLVIKGVCDQLRQHHPEVPVLTIHDSVMTTEEHLPLVEGLLRAEFRRFPLQPRFRVKGS